MKIKILIVTLLFALQIYGQHYLSQIPFKYDYSLEMLKKQARFEEVGLKNTIVVNDNAENLSDSILSLKEKYSIIMGVLPNKVINYKLYAYIDSWINTPFKEKSFSRMGLDCSYFLQSLYSDIYQVLLPKDPSGMWKSKALHIFTGRNFLNEGDLVFFRYSKDYPISDVGLYLQNDRILACTEKGLAIFNFNEEYFQLRYVGAARINDDDKRQ